MKCRECGAELGEGTKFCPNCGAKIEVIEDFSTDTSNWGQVHES